MRVKNGELKPNSLVRIPEISDEIYSIQEMGIFNPNPQEIKSLKSGQVGFVFCNLKDAQAGIKALGCTIMSLHNKLESLPAPEK